MEKPRIPANENERLAELRSYEILDTGEEQVFDDFTKVATLICGTPIALISLIDENRQWFKSKVGVEETETPRDIAFCAHVINEVDPFIINDATKDKRFVDNPLVVGETGVRFYAGVPLMSPNGYALGSFCVIDRKARTISREQAEALEALGRRVVDAMEQRKARLQAAVQLAELTRSYERLHLLEYALNAGNFACVVADAKVQGFPLVMVNDAFLHLTGYSREEVIGRNCNFLQGPDTSRECVVQITQGLRDRKPIDLVVKNYKKNGDVFWNSLSIAPVFDAKNELTHFVGFQMDVSERIQTSDLVLRQQRAVVNSARLAALGEMAGGISHEINNPLSVISASAESILRQLSLQPLDAAKLEKSTLRIQKTSQRIQKIINGLRTFSRDGQYEEEKPVSLAMIISDVLDLCQEKMRNRSITMTVDNPYPDLMLRVKQVPVGQVLLNLIANARDAVDSLDERWISIKVAVIAQGVEISVIDAGALVKAEVLEKMFNPFFTTKPVGQGTGLGLSVSKNIMEEHGGSLYFNKDEKNTCFVMRFPKQAILNLKTA